MEQIISNYLFDLALLISKKESGDMPPWWFPESELYGESDEGWPKWPLPCEWLFFW